jgi:hypothetical protein
MFHWNKTKKARLDTARPGRGNQIKAFLNEIEEIFFIFFSFLSPLFSFSENRIANMLIKVVYI